jgi:hypothetical protein
VGGGTSENWRIIAGNAFGVTRDGHVYASAATISGTITATGGKIGGWTIDGNDLTCNNVVLDGDDGSIRGSAISGGSITGSLITNGSTFNVTAGGALSATSAILTTLTVKGATTFTDTAYIGVNVAPNAAYDLYVNGKTYLIGNIGIGVAPDSTYGLKVNGKSYLNGNIGVGTTPKDGYTMTSNGSIYVVGSGNSIGNDGCSLKFYANGLWATGNLFTIDTSYCQIGQGGACAVTLLSGSTLNVSGDFTLSGNANFAAPENILVDGTQTLAEYVRDSAGIINIGNAKAVGYAVTAQKIGTSASSWTTLGSATKPLYLNNGVFTECNELGDLAFKNSIKKKVNITMSGSYTVSMSGYYTRGDAKTGYNVTDAAAYARAWRYCYYYNGKVYGPVSSVPSYATASSDGFYIAYDDGKDYVINNGSFTYYPTTAASNKTIKLTGSKTLTDQEFVGSDTDDDIDFTVSGITFTVST